MTLYCIICMSDTSALYACVPCGHTLCGKCATHLSTRCFECRLPYNDIIRVYARVCDTAPVDILNSRSDNMQVTVLDNSNVVNINSHDMEEYESIEDMYTDSSRNIIITIIQIVLLLVLVLVFVTFTSSKYDKY